MKFTIVPEEEIIPFIKKEYPQINLNNKIFLKNNNYIWMATKQQAEFLKLKNIQGIGIIVKYPEGKPNLLLKEYKEVS